MHITLAMQQERRIGGHGFHPRLLPPKKASEVVIPRPDIWKAKSCVRKRGGKKLLHQTCESIPHDWLRWPLKEKARQKGRRMRELLKHLLALWKPNIIILLALPFKIQPTKVGYFCAISLRTVTASIFKMNATSKWPRTVQPCLLWAGIKMSMTFFNGVVQQQPR